MMRVERLEERLLLNAGDLDVVFAGGKATANFTLGSAQIATLAVDGNGEIIAAGQVGSSNSQIALARFRPNGTLDTSFGTAGEVTTSLAASQNSAAKGVVIQADGKILVAGFAGTGSSQQFAVARYLANGQLDTTFGSSGSILTNLGGKALATSLALTPDGKIIVAASVTPNPFSSASNFALARYNTDGSLDTTFGTNGIVTTNLGNFDASANAVPIAPALGAGLPTSPTYKIIAAGHTSTSGGDFNFALVRYNADGSLDTTFNATGIDTTNFSQFDDIHSAILQPDGRLSLSAPRSSAERWNSRWRAASIQLLAPAAN
jgi:uncharacterized delta-60 repeat protein